MPFAGNVTHVCNGMEKNIAIVLCLPIEYRMLETWINHCAFLQGAKGVAWGGLGELVIWAVVIEN